MGLQCAKMDRRDQEAIRINKEKLYEQQISKVKEHVAFSIKISNLRILKFPESASMLKFSIPEYFDIQIPFSNFIKQGNIFYNKKSYFADINQPLGIIITKNVSIHIQTSEKQIEFFKKKFHHLLHGPVHHDHPLVEFNTRLLFDMHIDQIIHTDILLDNLHIQWKSPETMLELSHTLSLKYMSNNQFLYQTHKQFEKHQKIKFLALNECLVKSSKLRDVIIRLKLSNQYEKDQIFQFFFPFTKFQEITSTRTSLIDNVMYDIKDITFKENILSKGQIIGSIKLQFKCFISKLYTEQLQLMTFSEKGIVVATSTSIRTTLQHKKQSLKYQTIKSYYKKLNNFMMNGANQYTLYLFLQSILFNLEENEIAASDDIFKLQKILIQFLNGLVYFIQQEKIMQNECIWNIIYAICHQKIFKLKYFSSILNQDLKIQIGIKFYKFIINVMKKIINFTKKSLSIKESTLIHQFLAYAYFKFPWCQKEMLKYLKRPNDPIISQEKLGQIGASYALKSPSKNYFYDWQACLYRKICKKQEIITQLQSLQQVRQSNKQWSKILFDRDCNELFFSLYSTLWDEAQISLNNNGKIMWQYFPKYGQLLSFFIGQMNNNNLTDYTAELTKCNLKIIKNQRLLNTFMMLIFPKTHLYQTYCVIKCLDLIQCYFDVILKHHKKLPYQFHYNYFYTGIRCIFQSNHQVLLQKMLTIIYKYYKIFSSQFIETLNHFILKKVFYDLFLHWNHQVRNIFHFLLIFRIHTFQFIENPEKLKNSDLHENNLQYYEIFQTLHEQSYRRQKQLALKCPLQQEYFRKMKLKLKEKKKMKMKNKEFQFIDYNQFHHKNSYNEEESENINQHQENYMNSSRMMRRKWSLNIDLKHSHIPIDPKYLSYVDISLKEFQIAKKQKNPDLKIEMRRKTIEYNNDQ